MSLRKVLIVDDSRIIRLGIKTLLEKFNIEVIELSSVEELFQSSWRYRDVKLILLDIDLPGMDGLTALETMKQDEAIAQIPKIMLTGHGNKNFVKRAAKAGIVDYIRKPYTGQDFISRIVKILGPLEIQQEYPDIPRVSSFDEVTITKESHTGNARQNLSIPRVASFAEFAITKEKHAGNAKQIIGALEALKKLFQNMDAQTIQLIEDIVITIPIASSKTSSPTEQKLRDNFAALKISALEHTLISSANEEELEKFRLVEQWYANRQTTSHK